MREYLVLLFVLAIVLGDADEGLIGTCWYVPSSESWRVLVRRSERNIILQAARWEEKMVDQKKAALRAAGREWLDNCAQVRRLIA